MIILDTNVVSELMRNQPNKAVYGWVHAQDRSTLYTTAITRMEIRFGILRLPAGRRRDRLERTAMLIFAEDFQTEALSFDAEAADACADIRCERESSGRPIPPPDAQIAAIARVHGAPVATRNASDFDGLGLHLINPWTFGAHTP